MGNESSGLVQESLSTLPLSPLARGVFYFTAMWVFILKRMSLESEFRFKRLLTFVKLTHLVNILTRLSEKVETISSPGRKIRKAKVATLTILAIFINAMTSCGSEAVAKS